jgi:FkbM family methyltransferase
MDRTRERRFHAPAAAADRILITEGIEVRPGLPLTIVTESGASDPISLDLARGIYPPQYNRLLGLLEAIVPPGARVLDLGAHVGTFSLAAAALGHEVLAVEASPRNAAVLQASIEANKLRQMRVIHAAVSDRSGSLEFLADGPWGHVYTGQIGAPTVRVEAVTVQEILIDHRWDSVDFVKIDIEGSEVAALGGMKQLLIGPTPPPLFVESNAYALNLFNQTPDTLKRILNRYGYQTFLVEHDSLVPVKAGELQPFCIVDLVALKHWTRGTRTIRLDPPLGRGEIISRLVEAGRLSDPYFRGHVARVLRGASVFTLCDPRVMQLVAQFRSDDNASIREEAEQIRLPGVITQRMVRFATGLPRTHGDKRRRALAHRPTMPGA